ncbi:MAG: sigma-70 family RNA polymerase sigma factor, partial [Planctomycetota bacterium]|nr:sigma-70 family RNA polymerase sigma factor [Planctomycetota bacterium]
MEPNPFLELHDSLAGARRRFLDEVAPLRPELFRYARGLTGSVWDAEDLVQDTLTRAFASLGKFERVRNVRAYLFRVATNAWLDEQRRRRPSPLADEHAAALEDPSVSVPPVEWREALEILLGTLPPRARGAVLLRDVFGFSAAETAAALVTTVGAVKAALARGRRALANQGEPTVPELQHAVAPEVVDAFVDAFNARDLDAVLALVAPEATTEVVGIYTD